MASQGAKGASAGELPSANAATIATNAATIACKKACEASRGAAAKLQLYNIYQDSSDGWSIDEEYDRIEGPLHASMR